MTTLEVILALLRAHAAQPPMLFIVRRPALGRSCDLGAFDAFNRRGSDGPSFDPVPVKWPCGAGMVMTVVGDAVVFAAWW